MANTTRICSLSRQDCATLYVFPGSALPYTSSSCVPYTPWLSGDVGVCGWVGAPCTALGTGSNCNLRRAGACVSGVCGRGLGDSCPDDPLNRDDCNGALNCGNDGICGGEQAVIGAGSVGVDARELCVSGRAQPDGTGLLRCTSVVQVPPGNSPTTSSTTGSQGTISKSTSSSSTSGTGTRSQVTTSRGSGSASMSGPGAAVPTGANAASPTIGAIDATGTTRTTGATAVQPRLIGIVGGVLGAIIILLAAVVCLKRRSKRSTIQPFQYAPAPSSASNVSLPPSNSNVPSMTTRDKTTITNAGGGSNTGASSAVTSSISHQDTRQEQEHTSATSVEVFPRDRSSRYMTEHDTRRKHLFERTTESVSDSSHSGGSTVITQPVQVVYRYILDEEEPPPYAQRSSSAR